MSVRVAWKKGKKRFIADCRAFGLGQKPFKTRKEAEDHHSTIRTRYGSRPAAVPLGITFAEYAPRWEGTMREGLKPNTYRAYRGVLRTHLLPAFGDVRVRELTPAQILGWAQQKQTTHAAATTRLHLHVLRLICRRAVIEGVLSTNPVAEVVRELGLQTKDDPEAAAEDDHPKALTVDQLALFLAAAETATPLHAPMWRVQVMTGLRPGEVAGLHVQDLADDTGSVQEELSVSRTVHSNGRDIGPPKTPTARRRVELTPSLRQFLSTYLLARGLRGRAEAPLFPAARRAGYHPASVVAAAFKRALKHAGLPLHLSPHSLRHTYASIHLAHGTGDVYWLARQLGHKDLRMTTAIYGHWLRPRRPEALERFDGVLSAITQPQVVAA